MQLAAPEVLDLSKEPARGPADVRPRPRQRDLVDRRSTPLEETDYFGRKCLIARRLLERGVRFVQIWSRARQRLPAPQLGLARGRRRATTARWRPGMARRAAALIKDLKQRGLLDDTIILWTTEFGRMPCSQGGKGRDHNPFCFTNWLAGGGIKGGVSYGPSDEWWLQAARPRQPDEVLRHPRHDPAPARHRPHEADRSATTASTAG